MKRSRDANLLLD